MNTTLEELIKIAKGIQRGEIFSSLHIDSNDMHLLQNIFMPLIFVDSKEAEKLKSKDIAFIYEYNSRRGPMAINGYPMFLSCNYLNKKDALKLLEIISKLQSAENEKINEIKKGLK